MLAVCVLVSGLTGVSAKVGDPCHPVSGTVRNPLGIALSGATVSVPEVKRCQLPDSPRTVTTGSDGTYTLQVVGTAEGAQAEVTASKAQFLPETQLARFSVLDGADSSSDSGAAVLGTTGQNFSLRYELTPTIAPSAVHPGDVVNVSAASAMPTSAGSVVLNAGGTSVTLIPQSTVSGVTTWAGTYTTSGAADDGAYSVSVCGLRPGETQCNSIGNGTPRLTGIVPASYFVDTAAPTTVAGTIVPLEGGNALAGAQPLLARVSDGAGSWFDPSGAVFTLYDETVGTQSTHTGVAVSPVTGWVKTGPVTLVDGHHYRIRVVVTDRAGNATTVEQAPSTMRGGFDAMSITNKSSTAKSLTSMMTSACTVGEVGSDLQREVRCVGKSVNFAAVSVALSRTYHGGVARLTQTLALNRIAVTPRAGGAPLTTVRPFTTANTVAKDLEFTVLGASSSPVTYQTTTAVAPVPDVVVKVPAATTSADISMPDTIATVATMACTDPSTVIHFCSPDPLPPIVTTVQTK